MKGIGIAPGDLITVTYLKEGLERQPFRVMRLAPGPNYQTVQVTAQWHDDAWYTTGGAATAGRRRQRGGGVGLPRPLVGSVLDSTRDRAVRNYGDDDRRAADGSFTVTLSVGVRAAGDSRSRRAPRFRW